MRGASSGPSAACPAQILEAREHVSRARPGLPLRPWPSMTCYLVACHRSPFWPGARTPGRSFSSAQASSPGEKRRATRAHEDAEVAGGDAVLPRADNDGPELPLSDELLDVASRDAQDVGHLFEGLQVLHGDPWGHTLWGRSRTGERFFCPEGGLWEVVPQRDA